MEQLKNVNGQRALKAERETRKRRIRRMWTQNGRLCSLKFDGETFTSHQTSKPKEQYLL
jgi:hypothetical protein